MKILIILLSLVAFNVHAEQEIIPPSAEQCEALKEQGLSGVQLAKSGCCSWHQGVCGCQNGRVVCCDQSFSPSCTCNKEQPFTIIN